MHLFPFKNNSIILIIVIKMAVVRGDTKIYFVNGIVLFRIIPMLSLHGESDDSQVMYGTVFKNTENIETETSQHTNADAGLQDFQE